MNQLIIQYLLSYLTETRQGHFIHAVENRTRYLSVVLEDIFQSQNASAVLRTCDCFGIQDVHIIENTNSFNVNPKVVKGATKWLSLHHYNQQEENTLSAIQHLKAEGYRIIATSPHTNDTNLEDFDVAAGKVALVFGTEMKGISELVKQNADGFIKIPMLGFTESFNISVSAAVILHHLTFKLNQQKIPYHLTEIEQEELMLAWLKRSIKGSESMIEAFLKSRNL